MRHDTPVDAVEVALPGELALARVRRLETIESAYQAWADLRSEQRERQAFFARELRRLDEQGSLVLGAVRSARGGDDESGLTKFVDDSRLKLEALRTDLLDRQKKEEDSFERATATITAELRSRIERTAAAVKPVIRVSARSVGAGQRILHAARLGGDVAVTAFFAITGRIPVRYDFLFDDSTDDVTQVPPTMYEGPPRPTVDQLRPFLEARLDLWPAKGMIPFLLPGPSPVLARWLQRGAVMEAEIADGQQFRSTLTEAEAERFLGAMLSLKLSGRIELELVDA